ncbi:carbamoyltransferase HypF [Leptolyngbya sp. CCNP1308]|uniref:carbamoyltransferase HypF n=1 Tax=Leptolyngbya sp. CCNP1308 TaxID=3110255 RepID=UPI002B21D988|nr:carbamoyltransferase HypF [Leptolyngbya sp. CCNP1308]MEA5449132.1 carbamoyltransferase HypF [Leptolyngbya sp. CCNP1308]
MTTTSLIQQRICLTVQGTVQGVGFRPFVYQLAIAMGLRGGVKNTPQGALIDLEGSESALKQFLRRLQQEIPPPAAIQTLTQQSLALQGFDRFQIWPSDRAGDAATAQILPDLATCPACLRDIFDPHNRRYHYPFTSCTHCGPRFSIITALPYDRPHTTMAGFELCAACAAEYGNPSDRRFHAQPNACPRCGPQLEFWPTTEQPSTPMQQAIAALRQGNIVAIKGLGGFQLLVDAQQGAAVERLRQRKHRPDKPLALMYATLAQVRRDCEVSEAADHLLTSAPAPIVLLPKRPGPTLLATAIAPHTTHLGVMLPTTPLHHLLLQQYGSPLVATSGNPAGEPLCTDNPAAHQQLAAIADGFLVHNRPIQRPMDDSVVQIVQGRPQILRHARGYAPQAIQLTSGVETNPRILALGAHLKSAIALSLGTQVVLSQHIGDLETPQAIARLEQTVADWLTLYRCQPTALACDLHPDYSSTGLAQALAQRWQTPLIAVQHHYAHGLAAMAEHRLTAPVLAVAWDGTGYGPDQTIWGGEFLQITDQGFERLAHLRRFALPGGDRCSREPRRTAIALLYACYGDEAFAMTDLAPMQAFSAPQREVLHQMLTGSFNSPMTSSMGRLFDGVAALIGLPQTVSFEGQAAIALECAAAEGSVSGDYPFIVSATQPAVIDWRPMVQAVVCDRRQGVAAPMIAAKFHCTLVEVMGAIAQRAGVAQVVLTGGCFQNRILSEQAIQYLRDRGFAPYWHQRVPPNDGCIAVGQVLAALRHLAHSRS